MNRRQFLTGVSAAAVASALPAQAVTATFTSYGVPAAEEEFVALQQIYWRGRLWWITGLDNVIHFSEPCDPDWRSFCATREEFG